ncbi:MAG TPA: hypothetical protein VML19_21455 [Verrucomicrobiae bacterium]|nr:hypothetical protein [Verrucomicrobiae bacterium]
MKQICQQCHTRPLIDRVYQQAEQAVDVTNQRVGDAKAIVDGLRADCVLKGAPFTNRIDFCISICGTTTGGRRSTAHLWGARISCNGTEIIRCSRKWWS